MTIKEIATMQNGRDYNSPVDPAAAEAAKQSGFVICYGYSDDLVEFDGAEYDKLGAYGGKVFYIDRGGLIRNDCDNDYCPYYRQRCEDAKTIVAVYGSPKATWTFQTDMPHETFEIYDDGELFCVGIVFDLNNLQ